MTKNKYHNLGTVIKFEFLRTIKKPSFWLTTLAFPLIFMMIFVVASYSSKTSEEAVKKLNQEKISVAFLDESKTILPEVAQKLNAKPVSDKEQAINDVKNHKLDAFILYPKNPTKDKTEIYAKDAGLFDNSKYDSFAKNLLQVSATARIGGEEKLALAKGDFSTKLTAYEENGEVSPGIMKAVPPAIFIVIFYFIIILLGNSLLSSTVEEKENRVTEMILTSIHPDNLIVGKIIAMLLAGAIQAVTIFAPMVILYFVLGNSTVASSVGIPADFALSDYVSKLVIDPQLMLFGAIILTGSVLLYSGILVAFGAVMPTAKEANSWLSVILLLMIIPLYFISALISDPHSFISQFITFFPFTAPISALIRNSAGSLNITESIIISIELLILGIIFVKLAVLLFRKGSTSYSDRLSLKRFFK